MKLESHELWMINPFIFMYWKIASIVTDCTVLQMIFFAQRHMYIRIAENEAYVEHVLL